METTDTAVKTTRIVVGCNYHTTWQTHKAMRFVLEEVDGNRARLSTRKTNREFWTKVSDLIFVDTPCNRGKADRLIAKAKESAVK